MPFNLYTLVNIEPTHNTVLGALLYLSTLEAGAATVAGSGMWGTQPQFLHPLLADAQTSEGAAGFFFFFPRV